jgi:hypothetical protein
MLGGERSDLALVGPARLIQNLRRFLGSDMQYFAAIEPQRERQATWQRPRRSRSKGNLTWALSLWGG